MKYQFYLLIFLFGLISCTGDDNMEISETNSEFSTENGGECFLLNSWTRVDNLDPEFTRFENGTLAINLHEKQQLSVNDYNGNEFYFHTYNESRDEYCIVDDINNGTICASLFWIDDTLNLNIINTQEFFDVTFKNSRVLTCDDQHIKNEIPKKFLLELNAYCFQSGQTRVSYLIGDEITIENHPNAELNRRYRLNDNDTFTSSGISPNYNDYTLMYKYQDETLILTIDIEDTFTNETSTETIELNNLQSCM